MPTASCSSTRNAAANREIRGGFHCRSTDPTSLVGCRLATMSTLHLIGRFIAWTFAWAGVGAIAAVVMRNLIGGGDTTFIMTNMVAAGSIVGAIGGAMHAALAAACEREADTSRLANREARSGEKET